MTIFIAALAATIENPFAHADTVQLAGVKLVRIEGRANLTTASRQDGTVLADAANGGFALAWQSKYLNSGVPGVAYREFDPLGRPLSDERRSSVETGSVQVRPSLTYHGGEPEVAYEAKWRGSMQSGIFTGDRALEPHDGARQQGVSSDSSGDHRAWVWLVEDNQGRARARAKLGDSPAFWLDESLSHQGTPCVAADESGAVFAWTVTRRDGSPDGIVARRFDWTGKGQGPKVQVAGKGSIEPSIALGGGRAVLAYHSAGENGRYSVESSVYTAGLVPIRPEIAVTRLAGYSSGAAAAVRSDGTFAIAWNQSEGELRDVMLQFFSKDGTPSGRAVVATRTTEGDQSLAEGTGARRMAFGRDGLILAWSGEGGLGDGSGAYFTKFVPTASLSEATLRDVLAWKPTGAGAIGSGSAPELKLAQREVGFAGPHEPPIFTKPSPQSGNGLQTPNFGAGFNVFSQTSFTPPDCDLAIGKDYVVVTVNDGIAFYTKSGTQTFTANMRLTTGFWGQLAASDNFIYDPETFYDPTTDRYFVMATQGAGGTQSNMLIGVSDDGDPNGSWFLYKFSTTALAGNLFDSPNIGCDASVLYVTGDGFGLGANYPVYCIEKAPLLTGGSPIIRSRVMATSTQSAGIPDVIDIAEPAYYMVEHKEGATNSAIDVIALTDPLNTQTFQRLTLTVPSYTAPEDPPQQGTTSRPNTFDARFWSVKYRNGSLWAAHHVGSSRVLARWYQIQLNGWPTSGNVPTVVQSGNVDLGSTVRSSFVGVAADDQQNAATVYARSSPTEFLSMARSSRRYSDALGTMPVSSIDKVATAGYTAGRWGDYTGAEADPWYPGLFWGHGEWAQGASWMSWVQPYRVTNEGWATSLQLLRGLHQGGDRRSLLKADGSEYSAKNGLVLNSGEAPVQVVLDTRCSLASPTTLQFRWKHRVTASGLTQFVDAFDWTLGDYVTVDQRAAVVAGSDILVSLPSPARFLKGGTREMRVRLRVGALGPVSSSSWSSASDVALWIAD